MVELVGEDLAVPCVDGIDRPYLSLDAVASTPAVPVVAERVNAFLPWYSSVHRGAGWKSQLATAAYEDARAAAPAFAGRTDTDDVAVICRNTTEAINHLGLPRPRAQRRRATRDRAKLPSAGDGFDEGHIRCHVVARGRARDRRRLITRR